MEKSKTFKACTLYKRAEPNEDRGSYGTHLLSASYAEGAYMADCWPCDAEGNVDSGFQVPVPFLFSDCGEEVRTLTEEEMRRPIADNIGDWLSSVRPPRA